MRPTFQMGKLGPRKDRGPMRSISKWLLLVRTQAAFQQGLKLRPCLWKSPYPHDVLRSQKPEGSGCRAWVPMNN